jgi:Protein of unknown function (DUF4035)
VRELLLRCDSHELTEWQCFFALEPWGEERADLRAGIITSTLANIHRDPATRREPFQPSDFMPRYDAPERAAPKPVSSETQRMYHRFVLELRAARAAKQAQQHGGAT